MLRSDTYDNKKTIYEKQVNYGLNSEKIFFELLKSKSNLDFQITPRYDIFDFQYISPEKKIYIELKTRTIQKDKYETTLIAKNKINYFEKINHKNKSLYLVFGFKRSITTHNNYDYYYLIYDKDLFDSFMIEEILYKLHYLIPVELLKPFDSTSIPKIF